MSKSKGKEHIMGYKLLYTGGILFFYILGRGIPLYGLDSSAYMHTTDNAEELLMQTIGGDRCRCSVFALGISPYMLASLFVQIILLCKSNRSNAVVSTRKIRVWSLMGTLFLAVIQSLFRVQELPFEIASEFLMGAKALAVGEMVTGAMVILWLAERNKKYGIGGQTMLIFVNILDGLIATLSKHAIDSLAVPLGISIVVMVIVLIMENTEKRIPVQRISIHNIYADKNYLAIKLNPIGVMPVMFASAFFMIPQFLTAALGYWFPDHERILWWKENMTLTSAPGIVVYIAGLYVLTILFSMIFISPGDITEQLLKSGDSILNLHAGRDTEKYLTKEIIRLGFVSAAIMGSCLSLSLFWQIGSGADNTLYMLPVSFMILTGIWCNLWQETVSICSYEAYRRFLFL